jgi:ferredoxin
MKIHVDLERCTGHGFCEGIAEDIFEVNPTGWVELKQPSPEQHRRAEVDEAVNLCPTQALSITE